MPLSSSGVRVPCLYPFYIRHNNLDPVTKKKINFNIPTLQGLKTVQETSTIVFPKHSLKTP